MILRAETEELFVIVPAEVVRTIDTYAGDKAEAGGMLLGRYRTPHIEVIGCSEPMASDIRTIAGFDRRDPGHQLQAFRCWNDSQGTVTFVGEWHTHPEANPSPSSIDLRTWQKAQRVAGQLPLVFMVRGYIGWWFGLGSSNGGFVRLNSLTSACFDER